MASNITGIAEADGWWVGVYTSGSAPAQRTSAHRVVAWGLTSDGNVVPLVNRRIGGPEPINYSTTREHIRIWHEDGDTPPPVQ